MSRDQALEASARADERFGAFGGRYVPETLISALDELTAAYAAARQDHAFREELRSLLSDYVGRPTPLYRAHRLEEAASSGELYLKREDLNHTGALSGDPASASEVVGSVAGNPCIIGAAVTLSGTPVTLRGGLYSTGNPAPEMCLAQDVGIDGDTTITLGAFQSCQ